MPINQVFTNGNDSFVATQNDSYFLGFLNGDDTLTVNGATQTTALMGSGDDRVTVRTGSSLLYGEGGDDRFDLYASAASAYGGTDNDLFYLRGGSGNSVYGEEGSDKFIFLAGGLNLLADGGDGNDIFDGGRLQMNALIIGGAGNDTFSNFRNFGGAYTIDIFGGTGNDLYRADPGGAANFVEYAGEGTDTVQVARYTDYVLPENIENLAVIGFLATPLAAATLTGNSLNNTIYGWNGDETFYGLDGNDRIFAKGGFDVLYGGNGNDLLDGGAGDDLLSGGDGNDILNGRAGNDTMAGGVGDDSYYVDSDGDVANEAADGGTDTVRTTVSFTLGDNVERLIAVGSSSLSLIGTSGNNNIYANGFDIVSGGEGNDRLYASAFDILDGGNDDDYLVASGTGPQNQLYGGDGNDIYIVGTSNVIWSDSGGYDVAYLSAVDSSGNYTLGAGIDDAVITDFDVVSVTGNAEDNVITAWDFTVGGVLTLNGLGGNDTLYGTAGQTDVLNGGDGNDLLVGRSGFDVMTGGDGADTYRFDAVTDSTLVEADTISDNFVDDIIDLSAIDAISGTPEDDAFTLVAGPTGTAGELWIGLTGDPSTTVYVFGDVDGDGTADFCIELFDPAGSDLGATVGADNFIL